MFNYFDDFEKKIDGDGPEVLSQQVLTNVLS